MGSYGGEKRDGLWVFHSYWSFDLSEGGLQGTVLILKKAQDCSQAAAHRVYRKYLRRMSGVCRQILQDSTDEASAESESCPFSFWENPEVFNDRILKFIDRY